MKKFEAGKTYYCRSICDSECKWEYTIERRTAKSVWISGNRFGIGTGINGEEIVYPQGKYSMAPILKPEKQVA